MGLSSVASGQAIRQHPVRRFDTRPDTVVVFSSHHYVRGSSGTWTVFTDNFSISGFDPARRYTFRISNGTAGGQNRVSQVSILLNGKEVMSASDVTTSVAFAVKVVKPLSSNSLQVSVAGTSGSYIDLDMISTPDPSYVILGPTEWVMPETPEFVDPNDPPYNEFTEYFIRPSGAASPYTLTLANGAPDGSQRLTGVKLVLNNTTVVNYADFTSSTASLMRQVNLVSDYNSYTITLRGDVGAYATLTFSATDTTPPIVSVTAPVESLVTKLSKIPVNGTVADETGGTVSVNGQTAVATPGSFADSVALPADGRYTITVHAVNSAGYGRDVVRHVLRDTQPPTLTVLTPPQDPQPVESDSLEVQGWSTDSTSLVVSVDGETVASGWSGGDTLQFRTTVPLDLGPNGIFFRARDGAGNETSFKRYIFRKTAGEGPAPGPVVSAPPLSETGFTAFLDQVSFLYTDVNGSRQQYDVVVDSLRPELAAVVRGRVIARDFGALPNVVVRVLGHTEYGYAVTRADGQFDMVVNGGSPLTLRFTRTGYLEAQRACTPPVNDYFTQDSVALIGKSQRVHVVQLDSLQVVRGRFSTDANGDREIRVLFQAGTVARVAKTPADTVALATLRLRLTEYTVGEDGPAAMPALLPPTTAYTYCVDFSVDEADSIGQIAEPERPAPDVLFTKPVVFYLPNFLDYRVGTAVPYGYYERRSGKWIAGKDAWVVKILSDSAGTVKLDSNGDGAPDSTARLDSLGISPAELQTLSAQYDSGAVLWRATTDRFSNGDCNVSFISPYLRPPDVVPSADRLTPNPCEIEGSIISCEDGTLGERVAVAGTPYTLNYRSFRAPGDEVMRTVRVPIVGDVVPPYLQRAIVHLDVAGKQYTTVVDGPITVSTSPVSITWDGVDAYGRRVPGAVTARISVGYEFSVIASGGAASGNGRSFGDPSGTNYIDVLGAATGDRRVGVIMWNRQTISLGAPSTSSDGLGGWTLDVHHTYDNGGSGTVYLGDGRVLPGAGGRVWRDYGVSGLCQYQDVDTLSALSVYPTRLAYGPANALYIADLCRYSVLRVDRAGHVRRVAGTNQQGSYNGDGPATERSLPNLITGLAIGPDGSVYIASSNWEYPEQSLVCVALPDGTIRKIIGGKPGSSGGGGDGRHASEAWTGHVSSLALGPDGSLFLGECNGPGVWPYFDYRVRRIGTDGFITTYAGAGRVGDSDSTGRATSIRIGRPLDLEVDDGGVLYIAEGRGGLKVRRVTPDGMMDMYCNGYPGLLYENASAAVYDMARAVDGSMYLLTSELRWPPWDHTPGFYRALLRRAPDGSTTRVGGYGYNHDAPGPVAYMSLVLISSIACGAENDLVAGGSNTLWKEGPAVEEDPSVVAVPSADASEVYGFAAVGDSAGRHLYTRDALTGGIRYRFGYDAAGRLASIRDAGGLITRIERSGIGVPLWIEGPFGHRTTLSLDANGNLGAIQAPLGGPVLLEASNSGLLQSYTDALGNRHTFEYHGNGRLSLDRAPISTGIRHQLSAPTYEGMKQTVEVTTGEGRVSRYSVANLYDGTRQREVVDPAGLSSFSTDSTDARRRLWLADGLSVTDSLLPDPRFGMSAPVVKLRQVRLPSGITKTIETTRSVPAGFAPPEVDGTWAEDVSVNSAPAYHVSFNSDSLLARITSPAGRVGTAIVDSVGRLRTLSIPGLADVQLVYDPMGRVTGVSQGGRGSSFGYDALGRLATIRDTLGRMTSMAYLGDDRPTEIRLPGDRLVALDYDDEWNLLSLTPPGRPAHRFEYNPVNRVTKYVSPGAGESDSLTVYGHNADGQLQELRRPGGDNITASYGGTSGRLDYLTTRQGQVGVTYRSTGQVNTISSPYGVTLTYAYDGSIDTLEAWSGTVTGEVSVSLDRDFHVSSQRVNGANPVAYGYDADGLMTRAGAMEITRRPDNGLVSGTTLGGPGGVSTTDSYSQVGELWRRTVTFGGNTLFEGTWQRDSLGRITSLEEVAFGTDTLYGYRYDDAGRLYAVTTNGDTTARYWYDANGNRTGYLGRTAADTATADYDAQDRLRRYQNTSYTYTPAGELAEAVTGSDTTRYTYDVLGNLLQVVLANGDTIDYVVDGLNRRVGRKLNGTWTHRWLYQNELNSVAELDSAGDIVARYVYGTASYIPDYMVKNDTTYRMVTDHLGSVRLVVDAQRGNVAQEMSYDAFGRVLEDTTPGFQCFGFAGGLCDASTGFVRFGARDYDPEVGRWTSKDPILFDAGEANLYAYAGSDPVNSADPAGLVAAPNGWEGLIPVWGPGKAAIHDFECGDWGWGTLNSAMAISDVFLVKSAFGAVGKGLWKFGGHSWSATRSWMNSEGWKAGTGFEYHHWGIPQNGWGAVVPNALKNQPWNVMSVSPTLHDAIHYRMTGAQRLWYGTPTAFKAAVASATGRSVGSSRGSCGCK